MKDKRLEKRIQLRVSEELWQQISSAAWKREQSVSSEIRRVLIKEFMTTGKEESTKA